MVELENLIHKTSFQSIQSARRVYQKKKNQLGDKDQREGECELVEREREREESEKNENNFFNLIILFY